MRLCVALLSALAITATVAACGDEHDYDSLEDCMVDHTQVEMLPELQALTVCLVDHFDLDWPTAAACEAYVTDHGGFTSTRAMACAEYIRQKEM